MSLLPFSGAFSFGSQTRFSNNPNMESPGPGQYQTPHVNKKSSSFGKQQKFHSQQDKVPAVGQYKIQYTQIQKVDPGRSILGKQKQIKKFKVNIGPGSYNVQTNKIMAVTHTFGYKFQDSIPETIKSENLKSEKIKESKSVHQFSIELKEQQKNQKTSFGKQNRNLSVQQQNYTPGPGQYNTDKQPIQPKISFSFTKGFRPQIIDKERQKLPGPGFYNQIEKSQSPQQTTCNFGTKKDVSNKQSDWPSPCDYFPQLPNKRQNFKFGRQKRKGIIDENDNPGPAHYESTQKQNTIKISIGKGEREQQSINAFEVPGPGQYQLKSKAIEGYKTSIRPRQVQSYQTYQVPGPGMYNIQNQINSPVPFFGTSDHLNNHDVYFKSQLGPGQYNVNPNSRGPSYSLGQKLPTKMKQVNDSQVDPQNLIGFIPSYLLKDKTQDNSKLEYSEKLKK